MSDTDQIEHFRSQKNRYSTEYLLNPPKHTKEEVQIIINELQKRHVKKVVEFGSGNGRLTIPLLQNRLNVLAVDISKESLIALQKTALRMSVNSHLSISQNIPSGEVSAFVGCDILHHVDLDIYLKKMNDALLPNGTIIFSEPNILNIAWAILITFFIDWRIEWRILYCNYFILIKKLKETKFTNIKIKGIGLLPPPFLNSFVSLQKINYSLGNAPFLKFFAYRYIITATKR